MKFLLLLSLFFSMAYSSASAQTIRRIDSIRLKKIVYPPLTQREGKGIRLPLPPDEHPRLFFLKKDIPAIHAKLTHPLMDACWQKIESRANYSTDGNLSADTIHNLDLKILEAIEAKAFLYAFAGDEEKGKQAVDCIFNLNNTLAINSKKPDVCRDMGRVILSTAMVYDWCHDLLVPDERQSLINIMESLATGMEIQWPVLKQNSVCGHGVEAQLARDMLACAIATYDEKPAIYERVAGRIFAEFIPAQNFSYPSGHHHQGNAYGAGRFQWEVYSTLLFDRMGYTGISRPLQGKMPYYWIYTRRPDGQILRDGDDYCEIYNPFGRYWTVPGLPYVATYYRDPYLMNEAIRQGAIGKNPLMDLLLSDPRVSAPTGELPLTRYFPSPYGGMVARTSWKEGSNSKAVVAEMKVAEHHFANHQHLDAGSFQLYYKGPLAVQSGVYQGTGGGYGSDHFLNYYQRTVAHNCMLVYDPGEKFYWHRRPIGNDGGQRLPKNGLEPATLDVLLDEEYCKAKVMAHGFGPDSLSPEYSYLKGDITRAYTKKVKGHTRSFVFLNLDNDDIPAAFIVYDCVTSSSMDYKKTWLLHCVQEPVIDGQSFQIIRNEKGYNGKLINEVLLPQADDLLIKKEGGQGKEYIVGGVNYPSSLTPLDNSGDGAAWRVEVSPLRPSTTNQFLNVMQVMDADCKVSSLPVERLLMEEMVGAQICDRIVLFSKDGNPVGHSIKLVVNGNKPMKVFVGDIEPGRWQIMRGKATVNFVNSTDGYLYFTVLPGEYSIVKVPKG